MKPAVHDEYRSLAERHWWFVGRRRIFARVLDQLAPLPPGARILDLGPGSGVNLPVLAPRGSVAVLDLERESLRVAASRGARWPVQGDATSPPLAPGTFDLVCALDVIEHLEDDRTALAAARRLLKPGGWLLVSVPALPLLWGRQDVLSGHYRRYRKPELRERIRGAGFAIERLVYFNTWMFAPILLVRLAMRPFLGRATRGNHSDFAVGSGWLDRPLGALFGSEAGLVARGALPIGVSLLCLARASD